MMSNNLLEVKDLSVNVEEQQILRGINLNIGKGETHVLMGPNGAGKSTLGYTIMGNPKYSVTGGEIIFNGKNIVDEEVNVRAKTEYSYHSRILSKYREFHSAIL